MKYVGLLLFLSGVVAFGQWYGWMIGVVPSTDDPRLFASFCYGVVAGLVGFGMMFVGGESHGR